MGYLAFFAFLWGLFFATLLISPLSQPRISIQLQSEASGWSQVFFSPPDGEFIESASRRAIVWQGTNSIEFPLRAWRGAETAQLRWDPLDVPGSIQVESLELQSLVDSESIPLALLVPSVGVSAVQVTDAGAAFVSESNDPQMLISISTVEFVQKTYRNFAVISGLAALLALVATQFAWRRWFRRWLHPGGESRLHRNALATWPGFAVPSWVTTVFAVAVVTQLGLLLLGSQRIGVSWDEPIRESALQEFLRSGWLQPPEFVSNGLVNEALVSVYGPLTLVLAHVFGAATGAHELFGASLTVGGYQARHLFVALLSISMLAYVATSLFVWVRSWRWALVGVAFTASVPLWVGHSMFNIKDAPVAAGFTVFTLGVAQIMRPARDRRTAILAVFGLFSGALLAVGTRPGIWVALAATSTAAVLAIFVLEMRTVGIRRSGKLLLQRFALLVFVAIFVFALMWILYPNTFSDPIEILSKSISNSVDFGNTGLTLTAGSLASAAESPTYIPAWLGAQLPILIITLALVGLGGTAFWYVSSFVRRRSNDEYVLLGVPVLLQALLVPLGSVFLGTVLYGGLRQLLFIFPALGLLSFLGLLMLLKWLTRHGWLWQVRVTWILVLIGLFAPIVAQVRLFPYSFAYFNAITAQAEVSDKWDIDGWWLSGRELLTGADSLGGFICADSVDRPRVDCKDLGVLAPFISGDQEQSSRVSDDELVLVRNPTSIDFSVCEQVYEVSRPLFGESIVLSRILKC